MSELRALSLGNGTTIQIYGIPNVVSMYIKNVETAAMVFRTCGSEQSVVETTFKDTLNTRQMQLLTADGTGVEETYVGYTEFTSMVIDYTMQTYEDMPLFTVTIAQPVDLQTLAESFNAAFANVEAKVASVDERVATIENAGVVDLTTMTLDTAKAYLVNQNKIQMRAYLDSHPVTSRAHGDREALYSVTEEKQTFLASMINMCQLASEQGATYTPSWNAVGEPCTYDWTLTELINLAFDMETFVRPLISLQQAMEVSINAATTLEEAIAAAIPFEEAATQMTSVNPFNIMLNAFSV